MAMTTQVTARLAEMSQLQRGWLDGEGEPVHPRALGVAASLAAALPESLHPLSLYAVPDGGVEIEWRDRHGSHTITVHPDGSLSLLTVEPTPAACPFCQHAVHNSGAECDAAVTHGATAFHLCLCRARAGMTYACPPQMYCQGGPLGYSDLYHAQRTALRRRKAS